MKNIKILTAIMVLATGMLSCNENDVLPGYSKKGTATATVASITASSTLPVAGETITLTLMYVNPASDPVKNVVLKAQVANGDYTVLETWDAGSAATDAAVTHEVTYVAPEAKTKVTFDMVITSQKPYPQIKRAVITSK